MAAERKVSDEEVTRLRRLHDEEGWTLQDLAQAFGVSAQHAGRLVRGDQRPVIAGLDAEIARLSVSTAVEQFLRDVELNAGDEVLAAMARSIAAKLDACGRSDSATAAQAVPRLASELVEVLDRLRERVPREPDAIDLLKQRVAARRLAARATANGGPSVA